MQRPSVQPSMTRHVAPGDGGVQPVARRDRRFSANRGRTDAVALSVDERHRAQHACCESDRSRYAAARGWLRQLLAGYVDADPADLLLGSDSDGKPRLRHPEVPWLHFNLSHSAGTVVVAVARRKVGVDVEAIRRDFPIDAAARRFLSVREQRDLAELHYDRRIDAFFATWSRREAYLKGIGVGLGQAKPSARYPPAGHWPLSTPVLVSPPLSRSKVATSRFPTWLDPCPSPDRSSAESRNGHWSPLRVATNGANVRLNATPPLSHGIPAVREPKGFVYTSAPFRS